MRINSFSSAGISSSVWSAITRTLTADPATDAGAATLVWTHAVRNLTTLTSIEAFVGTTGSLASATTLDLRPAALKLRFIWVAENSVSNLVGPGGYNGTTLTKQGADLLGGSTMMVGGNAYGPALGNANGSAINYVYMGVDFS